MKQILAITAAFLLICTQVDAQNATADTTSPQSKSSIQNETKKLVDWLGNFKLACTNDKKETVLTAQAKDQSVVIKTTYGDAGDSVNDVMNASSIVQLQVGNVITLLVSGPDFDEGSALIILPSAFSERIGPRSEHFPVLSRDGIGSALIYGDVPGESVEVQKLSCQLK